MSAPLNPSGLCMCGCGDPAPLAPYSQRSKGWIGGQPKRYINGHYARVQSRANKSVVTKTCQGCGREFSCLSYKRKRYCTLECWRRSPTPRRGGLYFDTHKGRWVIVCRDGTDMLYYRGVMAAQLGRLLGTNETVHHINGDPTDDRLENLMVLDRAEHTRLHARERRMEYASA